MKIKNWCLSLLFLAMAPIMAHAAINDGLVEQWAFDGSSASATLSGGPIYVEGNVGSGSLSLDGVNDYADTPSQAVSASNEFSVSWWMKSSLAAGYVLCWTNYRCASFSGGKLIFFVDGGSSGAVRINTSVTDGLWHHVVMVNRGNSQSIYLDGQLAGSATETLDTRAGGIRLGNRAGSTGYYAGILDDVRLYNKAISVEDIGALFELGKEKASSSITSTSPAETPSVPASPSSCPSTTQWYVNSLSSGDGSSWGRAWSSPEQIKWDCIKPGDSIYISGGISETTYTKGLTILKSGTMDKPITIATGALAPDPTGHDGRVIFKNASISFGNVNYVVVEGRKNPRTEFKKTTDLADINVAKPGQYIPGQVYLADNINMEVLLPDIFAGCVFINGAEGNKGIKLFGVEIHHCGEPMDREVDLAEVRAIKPYPDALEVKRPGSGLEIAYNYIHHTRGDAINSPTPTEETNQFGIWSIHHNVIEKTRDDGIQVGPGTDIYNNIIRTWWYPNNTGHPDGIQIAGNYMRIFNNIIYDLKNSYIRMESWSDKAGHWHIYNNIFFIKDQLIKNSKQKLNESPLVLVSYSFDSPTSKTFVNDIGKSGTSTWYDLVQWDDVFIANNSFVGFEDGSALYVGFRGFDSTADSLTNGYVGDLLGKNIRIANNVFHGIGTSASAGGVLSFQIGPQAAGDVVFENNSISGDNQTTFIRDGITEKNTFHEVPLFMNLDSNDAHVLPQDTALINQGVNLATYFTKDSDGIKRDAGDIWDIGPYENVACATKNPVAYFETTQIRGYVPLKVDFDATRSRSCDDAPLSFQWDLADGNLSDGPKAVHTYTIPGNYAVTLTAQGQKDNIGTYQKTIRVLPTAEPGLILYLDFNDNIIDQSGRLDALGNAQHNISWGGRAKYEPGKSGQAASIGPTGTLSVAHTSDLVGMNAFSYALWVKKSTASASGAPIAKVGAYFLKILEKGFSINIQGVSKTITVSNTDTEWHHYALSYDGAMVRWFFDGKKISEAPASGAVASSNTRALILGSYLSEAPFEGLMDELKIYEKALSEAQVLEMFNKPPVAPPSYDLNVHITGTGSVVSSSPGIDCPDVCSQKLSQGASVTLNAKRQKGYIFDGWSGACTGEGECRVSMGSNKDVTAIFVRTTAPDDSQLLLHLKLDDDFSDKKSTDSSSFATDAVAVGPDNMPAKTIGYVGSGAGIFKTYAVPAVPVTGLLGSCLAVPDAKRFNGLAQATISVWARYDAAANGDWTSDNGAALVSAGYAKAGAWELARNGSSATLFFMYATDGVSNKVYLRFPDEAAKTKGDTGGFNHYVVTFDKGTATIYYNGEFVQSVYWPISQMTVSGLAPWLGVGCKTHATTPGTYKIDYDQPGGDPYPNHGWMNGAIDDVRMYNRVLSPSEIANIYDSQATGTGTTPLPPVTGSGDVSGDGKVTMYDAALALRYSITAGGLTQAQITEANMDGNKNPAGADIIDNADVMAIVRKALGL